MRRSPIPTLIADGAPPEIRIAPDKTANTLSVARQRHRHGPPGADRQSRHHRALRNQVVPRRSLTEAKDGANLIGQFGVGFYAAFMVAEKIVVTSRRAGSDEVWVWTSVGRQRLRDRARERGGRQRASPAAPRSCCT